jgi:transcriptional regulator with XRE-family HTH domain
MTYPASRQECDAGDIKPTPKLRQAKISPLGKSPETSPFGLRLLQLFGNAKKGKVAEKMGVANSSVTAYLQGDSYPSIENLIKISELTKCNLHWLLTGEDDPGGTGLEFLEEGERELVGRLAEIERRDVDGVLRSLVQEGLRSRARHLISRFPDELEIHELREVEALLESLKRRAQSPAGARKKTGGSR